LLEVMRCMLLCMFEAVEGRLCLREVSELLEALEVTRCMLRTLYAGGAEVRDVLEVTRCVLRTLYAGDAEVLEVLEVTCCVLRTLYVGGCGGCSSSFGYEVQAKE